MSSRTALQPVSASQSNSRASIGANRAVAGRKPGLAATNNSSSASANNSSSATGRKSLGGKQDEQGKPDSRRSMLPPSGQARPSLAPTSRPSMARQSLSSRPSLLPNHRNSRGSLNPLGGRDSLSRRTSLFGQADNSISKDPRPIKEKPYIAACVQRVEQYLVDSSYDKPISQSMMLAPSSKDFFYMLEFCLRRIDPSFSFKDPKKPEEETPAIFKALKYPFGMSARALASVGTPHAWPNFLACLHWLIELLNYDDFAQLHRDELLIEDRTSQEALRYSFFNFIGQAYQAFMSFDDRETQLEADFVRTLLDRNNERQEATSRLQEHTQQIQEETVRLRNQDSRVHNLTRAVETSEFDLEKLKAEVMKLKEANESTTARLVEVKAKGSAQRESVERLQHELAQLDHILHHQAERGWDAEKMSTQKQEVKQTIVTVIHLRDEVEQASNTIEMEISEKFREVEKGVSTLNGLLDLTGLVKTLGGEVRVLPQSPSILSADIKESVKPVLTAFLEQQRRIHMQNQPLLVEMQAKAEERQEEVSAKRTGLSELKARVDRELAHFNELRESFQQPRKALEQEIVELEKDIGAIALASKDSLATRRKERSDIVMRLEDKRAAFEKEELELNDILNRYIDWIVTHQETIAAKFTALETSLARQIDQN